MEVTPPRDFMDPILLLMYKTYGFAITAPLFLITLLTFLCAVLFAACLIGLIVVSVKNGRLDVPLAAEVAWKLRKQGIKLPEPIVTDEELAVALCR